MDDRRLVDACAGLIASSADESSSPERRNAVGFLAPHVHRQLGGLAVRNAKLVAESGMDVEDIAQIVLERLQARPPNNAAGRDPVAVVFGWVRAVALRLLLDRKRRRKFEGTAPVLTDDDGNELPVDIASTDLGPEDRVAIAMTVAKVDKVAEELRAKYAVAYRILRNDPDITAEQLAKELGYPAIGGKVAAWKVKQRLLDELAERMGVERRRAERQKKKESAR